MWDAVEEIHTSYGFSCDSSSGIVLCTRPDTCSSIAEFMPSMELTVGSDKLTLAPEAYLSDQDSTSCTSLLTNSSDSDIKLGLPLFRSYVVQLDFGNTNITLSGQSTKIADSPIVADWPLADTSYLVNITMALDDDLIPAGTMWVGGDKQGSIAYRIAYDTMSAFTVVPTSQDNATGWFDPSKIGADTTTYPN
jgi:hypothetical protein